MKAAMVFAVPLLFVTAGAWLHWPLIVLAALSGFTVPGVMPLAWRLFVSGIILIPVAMLVAPSFFAGTSWSWIIVASRSKREDWTPAVFWTAVFLAEIIWVLPWVYRFLGSHFGRE